MTNGYAIWGDNTYTSVTATTWNVISGATMVWETDEEKVKRIRKAKKKLRNKKLTRIYGPEPEGKVENTI